MKHQNSWSVAVVLVLVVLIFPVSHAHATGNSWESVGSPDFTAGGVAGISLVKDSQGNIYVGYTDTANNNEATVREYNPLTATWAPVGTADFSASSTGNFNLAIDSHDTLYAAYTDANGYAYKATVMKYSGGSWAPVGGAEFTTGTASPVTFALDASDTPYIAFADGSTSNKLSVMKYTSGSWAYVGSAGISSSTAQFPSLAFDSNNTPYLAYMDGGHSSKATVLEYTGGVWNTVGSPGITSGQAQFISFKFGPGNTPYFAFQDASNSYMVSVMKYSSGSWTAVGSLGFGGPGDYTSLAFDKNGTPYVGYRDDSVSSSATVMSFDGTNWNTVGSAGFGPGYVGNATSLLITSNDVPYIAFNDAANGEKANVMAYGTAAPTLSETTPVPSSGDSTTPSYTFTSDQAGSIAYGGSCSSDTTSATAGANTITFDTLALGTYSDCTITVVNDASQTSTPLVVSSFTIVAPTALPAGDFSGGTSVTQQVANLETMGNTALAQSIKSQWPQLFGNISTQATSSTATSTVPISLGTSAGSSFIRDLKLGMTGADVKALQQFLNAHGAVITTTGAGSPGNETTYFGALTKKALAAYQKASGISPAAGYFGPLTRAYIALHQ